MKWLFLVLGMVTPSFAAVLTGRVQQENGTPVNEARVFVFHEVNTMFVHRQRTDRNGNYVINLEPGPYRIVIVHQDFWPKRVQMMILDPGERISLHHKLMADTMERKGTLAEELKKRLRNGNDRPDRDLLWDSPIQVVYEPTRDDSLKASLNSRSRQGLGGEMEQASSVEVRSKVNDQVALASSFTNENRHSYAPETLQILAGFTLSHHLVDLNVQAESIQTTDSEEHNHSRAMRISGSYGDQVKSTTGLSITQSARSADDQQELSLSQELTYALNKQAFQHHFELTDWQRNDGDLAQYAQIITTWKPREASPIGLRTDLDYIGFANTSRDSSKLWLTGEHRGYADRWSLSSRVGIRNGDDDQRFVQHHILSTKIGALILTGTFDQDSAYQSFDSREIFGHYVPEPLTPYATESFYKNEVRESTLRLSMNAGSHWDNNFWWRHVDDDAMLLHANDPLNFRTRTRHSSREYGYALVSERWQSKIEISHSQNRANSREFDQTGVAYVQTLSPFRNGAMGVLLELQMRNQPRVPAWWLLNDLPWDPDQERTWFEGHVSLQF